MLGGEDTLGCWSVQVESYWRDGRKQQNIRRIARFSTVYLCVWCGSENKQRLFPYTALTDSFL